MDFFLLLALISKRLDLERCGLRHFKAFSFFFPTVIDFLSFDKQELSYDKKHLLRFFLAR